MIYFLCCHSYSGDGKGVLFVADFIISVLIAVVSGVICHYITKWLDGNDYDN